MSPGPLTKVPFPNSDPLPDYTFIIPDPDSFVSGGNRYNGELLTALKAAGKSVSVAGMDPPTLSGQVWLDSIWMDQVDRLSKRPDGLIVHHLGSFYPETASLSAEEEIRLLRKFDRFLCTSPYTKDRLVQYGISAHACFVIEPGMHLSVPSGRTYPANLNILMVANLVRRKGILPFLQAFNDQSEEHHAIQVTIAGSHELDSAYATLCSDLVHGSPNLTNRVTFLKDLSPIEITEAYLQHSLLVSAAEMETYGMAIREAICLGLPVFCLENSGYADQHPGIFERHSSINTLVHSCLLKETDQDFPTAQAGQWTKRPLPISWKDQAQRFIRHTESWIASR